MSDAKRVVERLEKSSTETGESTEQDAINEATYRLAVEDLRLKGERILSIRKEVGDE